MNSSCIPTRGLEETAKTSVPGSRGWRQFLTTSSFTTWHWGNQYGSELTALEVVGCGWYYTCLVVQAKIDDGGLLHQLHRLYLLSHHQKYQRCSSWYLHLNVQYLSPCGHFWKFVKAKTKTKQILSFLCVICASLTAIFRCALCLIECPGMLATHKLSVKQTFCDWIGRWQPDSKSHFRLLIITRKQELVISKAIV